MPPRKPKHRPPEPPPAEVDPQNPSAELLLWAYRQGVFPMGDPSSGLLEWFSPLRRGIIPLDAFHVPGSLARVVRNGRFAIRCNTAFEAVMRACAPARSSSNGSWINETIIRAYVGLHTLGHAHSIEAWLNDMLVGGLYGVHIGGAFFGESMFSRPALGGTNASKVCLVHLVHWLKARGFTLLDTQFVNDHLLQFGCKAISAAQYRRKLAAAVDLPVTWGTFEYDPRPCEHPVDDPRP